MDVIKKLDLKCWTQDAHGGWRSRCESWSNRDLIQALALAQSGDSEAISSNQNSFQSLQLDNEGVDLQSL